MSTAGSPKIPTKQPYMTSISVSGSGASYIAVMDTVKMYKVAFDQNKATTTKEVSFPSKVHVERETVGGENIVKSITVYAESERESLATAQDIANCG